MVSATGRYGVLQGFQQPEIFQNFFKHDRGVGATEKGGTVLRTSHHFSAFS